MATTKGSYDGIVFSPADLMEPCDLTEEQKKRILYVEMHLDKWNHYALLGLKRTADAADIKRGYFRASKEFHPDAYFRKELGSYKRRIERIFRAMKAAYDVLSDPERRREYDQTLGADFTPEELAELEARAEEMLRKEREEQKKREAEEAERARQERLQQRLKERRLKRNPMLDRIKRARDLLQMAEQASRAGRKVEAARHARLALEFAPKDAAIKRQAEPLIREGNRIRAGQLLAQAKERLALADFDGTAELAEKAVELAAGDPKALVDAGHLLLATGRRKLAFRCASQAAEARPKSAEAWALLLEVSEREEKWHIALRAAEHLFELKPGDKAIKDRLKHAKRMAK